MSTLSIVLSIVFGIASGVFGGLGMGGGTLLIPLLTIFLNYSQKLAQGINLLSFLIMALIGLFIHVKHGFIKTKGTIYIMIFGVIFSILGSTLMSFVSTNLLRKLFGGFLCLLSVLQVIKIIKN